MDNFISYFYFIVYSEENANYYWHSYGTECCLNWGFYVALLCALFVALFYYFYWSNIKVHLHASLKSWFVVGFWGMILTFLASELVLGSRCTQLEGMTKYIGETGCDILVFSLYNGIVSFAIFYFLISIVFQLMSNNAKNIPLSFMYRK